jgi:hypothetical protein
MSNELVSINVPRSLTAMTATDPALFLPDARAGDRLFEFFTAHIRNKNTRRPYFTRDAAAGCASMK